MEIHAPQNNTRDHPLMTSDFKGGGGFKMTPKNRTLGGGGGQNSSKIVGHHL